jgi:hypothetical protein
VNFAAGTTKATGYLFHLVSGVKSGFFRLCVLQPEIARRECALVRLITRNCQIPLVPV